MKLIKISFCFFLFFVFLGVNTFVKAEGDGKKNTSTKIFKPNGTGPYTTKFNINNISTFFMYDGDSDINPIAGASGFQFPIGSGKTVFYESGFLYGGNWNGKTSDWRVSGSTYNRGQIGGRIITPGTVTTAPVAQNPNDNDVRIYRVRRDYKDPQADYSKEISDEGKTKDQIYAQYDKDWKEWPAKTAARPWGNAPFDDKNGNGVYDPDVDIPGVPGADQTIWFVANDSDPTQSQHLYSSVGLGLEMQATIWGYNQSGALGDALFRKYTLINKSGVLIDSMYVCMWSDPDLGETSTDDFGGCDTTLSLGYIYNATDSDPAYGRYIPASGFDFLQGPLVKGVAGQDLNKNGVDDAVDYGIFKNKKSAKGYINLPMTAFFLFTRNVTGYGDPALNTNNGTYTTGALQVRNLFQGKVGSLGTPFQDPITHQITKYFAPGDPVTGKGWVDGILFPANDRRIGTVSGPFKFAAGDTQEVVVGQLAAGGVAPVTRLGAVAKLKFQDRQVQNAYDNFFVVPPSPQAPVVPVDPNTKIGSASEFDRKIIISWGDDAASVAKTESYNTQGYKFEGYVVYQLRSLTTSIDPQGSEDCKIVGTFDLATDPGVVLSKAFDPVTNQEAVSINKYGTNSGVSRIITIDKDLIRGGIPLANGTPYYFVVSSYVVNSNSDVVPNVLESFSARISATPHTPDPGTGFTVDAGTAVAWTHTQGGSDGKPTVTVVDPSKVTGDTYEITFTGTSGNTKWTLTDKTTGVVKFTGAAEGQLSAAPIVDGLQVDMSGAPNDFKYFTVTANAGGKLAQPNMGTFAFNANGFPLYNGWDRPQAGQMKNSTALWGIVTGMTSPTMLATYAYFLTRVPRGGANWPYIIPWDFEIRFTAAGSKANMAFSTGNTVQVPFELWNTGIGTPNNSADDFKLAALVYDVDGNDQWNLLKEDHSVSGGDDDPDTDWIYFYDVTDKTPGTKGYDAVVASNFDEGNTTTLGHEIMARVSLCSWNGGSVSAANFPANQKALQPETGAIFRIETTKPNQPTSGTSGDKFSFTAPTVTKNDMNLALQEVDKINVFPNPYYAVNPREVDKYRRFVTFNHLPQRATIRIFNLAGQIVRILQKDDPSQFTTWDLQNGSQFPVSSGLYIIYVDLPDLGKSKIIKLAVVQEQQMLDKF